MLRAYNQHGGGVNNYTRNLLRELLSLETSHEFVLIYPDSSLLGTFGNNDKVREVAVDSKYFPGPNMLAMKRMNDFLWDQIAVQEVLKRENVDLLFNPKYSVPLKAKCRTIFVCHGLDWYVMPWGSRWFDRLNHRYLIPRYARKADAIISVSNTTREHVIEYLGVDEKKVHTVHHGIGEYFKKPVPPESLEETRKRYRLPERFFLFCGQIYPAKNFGRLIQAYSRVGPELGIPLVVAGEHSKSKMCAREIELIEQLDITRWVSWLGWIDPDTLPAIYALAEALFLPSLYESFGIPIVEAMSIGCPVLTSDRYGTREMVSDAGVLVDPEDIDSIAEGILKIATDQELRKRIVAAGHARAMNFSWRKCAQETLDVLENVMSSS